MVAYDEFLCVSRTLQLSIPDTQNTVAPCLTRGLAAFAVLSENALPILASGKAKPRISDPLGAGATIIGGRIRQLFGRSVARSTSLKADIERTIENVGEV